MRKVSFTTPTEVVMNPNEKIVKHGKDYIIIDNPLETFEVIWDEKVKTNNVYKVLDSSINRKVELISIISKLIIFYNDKCPYGELNSIYFNGTKFKFTPDGTPTFFPRIHYCAREEFEKEFGYLLDELADILNN